MRIKPVDDEVLLLQGCSQLRWIAFVGVVWLALGVAYIPINKIYQQGIVFLFYVPLLAAFLLNLKKIFKYISFNRVFFALLSLLLLYSALNSAVHSNYKSIRHILYVLIFVFSGFFMVFFNFRKAILRKTLGFVLFSVSLISLGSFFNFFYVEGHGLFDRMWGFLGINHPILGSYYIGIFLLVSLFLFADQRKLYVLPYIITLSFFILFAQSRGAYAAIFIAVLLYALLITKKDKHFTISLFVFLGCATLLGYLFSEQIMSRGSSYRPEIIASSIEMGIEKLWFGYGVGHKYSIYTNSYPVGFDHTHNLPLHIFIELGLVGVIFFSALWLYCLFYCYKNRELGLARLNILLIVFSGIAFQFDVASFIAQPRLAWAVSWLPICLTAAVNATLFLESYKVNRTGQSSRRLIQIR